MLQKVRVGGGVQAGAGQLIEGWDEQSAEASAGASVSEVDGVRRQGWSVSDSCSSPADIAGASSVAAPLWTAGCFSDSACFLFQAALIKPKRLPFDLVRRSVSQG